MKTVVLKFKSSLKSKTAKDDQTTTLAAAQKTLDRAKDSYNGAQMLYAAAAAGITTYAIIPYTFYPILMAISAFVFIFGFSQKEKSKKES